MFGKNKKEYSSGGIEFIVVGLGNPGKEYENTRHNCGFMAMDKLAEKYNCKLNKIRFKSTTGECNIEGHRCLLMKPSTYMNLSGQAVVEAKNFYKIAPENIVIMFDDVSLDMGKLRIRRSGSDGGQNGVKNIIYLSGSDKFPRVKIGVGKKPHPEYDLKDWVLSRFSKEDMKTMDTAFENAAEAAALIIDGKTELAMQKFN